MISRVASLCLKICWIPIFFACVELQASDVVKAERLLIEKGCTSCHRYSPVPAAKGLVGPPLDHISEQSYIAGILPNTRDNLTRWLMHPRRFHARSAMPNSDLTWDQARLLSNYLWDN